MVVKKIVLSILIIICAVVFYILRPLKQPTHITSSKIGVSPTPRSVAATRTYAYHGKSYTVSWYSQGSGERLHLYENFSEKLTATQFSQSHKCSALSNGGFYTPDRQPIGLFATDGKIKQQYHSNTLLNGILTVNENGNSEIRVNPPAHIWTAVQSGPILVRDGHSVILHIFQDEGARRLVIAITEGNTLIILAFYDSDNSFKGPLLSELPDHIKLFSEYANVQINTAINLDGGSASTFISPDVLLAELVPVGSFLCVN